MFIIQTMVNSGNQLVLASHGLLQDIYIYIYLYIYIYMIMSLIHLTQLQTVDRLVDLLDDSFRTYICLYKK